MYIAKLNRNENKDEIQAFIRDHGFAILISTLEGKPWATHTPILLSEDGSTLSGHIARANKQWKEWANQPEVLVIFSGPHAYVSSSWYDHENVPTWNYLAIHVYGKIRIIEGEELLNSLKDLTNKYEANSEKPVTVEGMSEPFVSKEILGVVGFEISINKIEAAYKLSQNRDDKNYEVIINRLRNRKDENSNRIAEEMAKLRSNKK